MIHDIVAAGSAAWPDRPALVTGGGTITYGQLATAVDHVAARLARSGDPGDRVAVVGANSIDYVIALYAVPAAGRVLALVNQRLHPLEQARLCDRVGATMVIGDGEHLRAIRPLVDPGVERRWRPFPLDRASPRGAGPAPPPVPAGDDDPAWLIPTSGTTGPAKTVPLSAANLHAAIAAGSRGRPVADDDVYLFPFPLCHVAAYNVLLQHGHGATVVLTAGFDAGATLATLERQSVTTMSLAPTMIVRLLEHPALAGADLSTLRSIGYGAAALPARTRARAEERLGCVLVEGYGMTELAGNVAFDGRPDRDIELRVVDEAARDLRRGASGEIVVRGAQVTSGYWRDDEATAAAFVDGWFRTGDIGRLDGSGRLTVVDRLKDIIITGGENVASREVEDVLAAHPGVAEVAVVGLPDAEWGERVAAVIVPAGPVMDADLGATLTAHCRERLAGFKTPRVVEVVDALPVNATGKVDKAALRRSLAG